jgi:LuxR family maltose regulon positive regulatory protein
MHSLVRQVVEDELATTDAERHRSLHNRAARWCRGQGDEVGAMRHLVAGGDLDGAWKRFRDHWAERYFAGDFATVRGWCDILAANAQLDVERASELAIALLLLGRLVEAEHFVIEASLVLDASDEPHNECLELARFLHANWRGALDIAIEHAALARVSDGADGPPIWRRMRASLLLASALAFCGRLADADVELRRAATVEDPASPVDAVVFAAAKARLALLSGHLLDAEEHALRSLDAAALLRGDSRALLCEALGTMGYIQLERNELVAAERDLQRAVESADAIGYAPVRVVARLSLARVHHARGHRELAFATIAECRRLGGTRFDHHFTDRIAEAEAQLRLSESDAIGALQALPPDRGHRLRLIEARALAAMGDHAGALALVADIDSSNPYRAVRVHLVRARCAFDAQERRMELTEAIGLAEVSGLTRLLLDERQWLLEHLHALAPAWPTDYVAGLIERSVQELAIRTPADRLAKLSERELEVWRQLSTPLSLSEISRRLFISRNTMKTHVRNIYRKLEVATREAAVAVASSPTAAPPPGRRSG